ncbi:MAG: hypothetical protein N2578_07060 [Bdellovibrionaceae bacterium]|nr:hypothetical protein [Pseudobdellovibrionaceae bacterium]
MKTDWDPKTQIESKLALLRSEVDDLEMPLDEEFYEKLHNRIMLAIEQTEIESPPPILRIKRSVQASLRQWLGSGALSLVLVIAALAVSEAIANRVDGSHAVQSAWVTRELVHELSQGPDGLAASLITQESDREFFVDLAKVSIQNELQEGWGLSRN